MNENQLINQRFEKASKLGYAFSIISFLFILSLYTDDIDSINKLFVIAAVCFFINIVYLFLFKKDEKKGKMQFWLSVMPMFFFFLIGFLLAVASDLSNTAQTQPQSDKEAIKQGMILPSGYEQKLTSTEQKLTSTYSDIDEVSQIKRDIEEIKDLIKLNLK